MTVYSVVAGDVDTLTPTLQGVSTLADVTGVEAHVYRGDARVALPATVADPAARVISVPLSPWLATAEPGRWCIEFECSFPAGPLTWPADRPDILIVRPQGDPTA